MSSGGVRALVTGGARRIGRAIALELAQAGCDLAIHYHRSEAEAGDVVEQITGMVAKSRLEETITGII